MGPFASRHLLCVRRKALARKDRLIRGERKQKQRQTVEGTTQRQVSQEAEQGPLARFLLPGYRQSQGYR